uniref:G-protein coupled receptors family 2 profile 2 domain-containing protein n=1 Tax=Zonotrichia albicollis TaxID=44394 RepID=A0A8D2MET8_ZONAL
MVLCFQELRNAGSPRACAVCATKCPGQVSTGASLLGAPVNSLSVPPVQCTEHSNTPNRFVYLELFSIWKYFIVTLSCLNGGVGDLGGTSWDCVLQGALSTFANTSSFFWTMAIALYLYLSIVRGSPAGQGLLWGFHAVSWGVPLAITVAAVALRKIGYDASNVSVGWCWVNLDAEDRLLWMLLAGKLWEILAYVTLPVLYLLIRKHINRAVSISPQELFARSWPCPLPSPTGSQLLEVSQPCSALKIQEFDLLPCLPAPSSSRIIPVPMTTTEMLLPRSCCVRKIFQLFCCHKQIFAVMKGF